MVWQQSSRGPATFVQDAAAAALTGDQACVRTLTAEYQARRDFVIESLRGIPGVVPLVPEGGLFVMLDIRELAARSPAFQKSRASAGAATASGDLSISDDLRRHLLHEAGVVVIHGGAYGPAGEGTLRVSFAAGGTTLERGVKRLRDGLGMLSTL
jgi:aspartate aminotransferase